MDFDKSESYVRLAEVTGKEGKVLADYLSVSPQTVTNWAKRRVSRDGLILVAEKGINPHYISTGIGSIYLSKTETINKNRQTGYKLVPVIGNAQMGDCGYWTDIEQGADGYIPVNNASPKAYAMRGKGMSAFPVIRPGWFLAFEPEKELISGEFVHVKLKDGRNMIKEFISKTHDTISLLSVNGNERLAFPVEEVEFANGFKGIYPPSEWLQDVEVVEINAVEIDAE